MKTEYKGIDYGLSVTNIDPHTGIRYGVINQNDVLQAWADSSEPYFVESVDVEDDDDFDDFAEPISFFYEEEGYSCECGEDGDIFVMKSPYFTYAQFCSPCAPGACYLMNPLDEPDENNKCYCFDFSWFEDGKAPYLVYSVETNELILHDAC